MSSPVYLSEEDSQGSVSVSGGKPSSSYPHIDSYSHQMMDHQLPLPQLHPHPHPQLHPHPVYDHHQYPHDSHLDADPMIFASLSSRAFPPHASETGEDYHVFPDGVTEQHQQSQHSHYLHNPQQAAMYPLYNSQGERQSHMMMNSIQQGGDINMSMNMPMPMPIHNNSHYDSGMEIASVASRTYAHPVARQQISAAHQYHHAHIDSHVHSNPDARQRSFSSADIPAHPYSEDQDGERDRLLPHSYGQHVNSSQSEQSSNFHEYNDHNNNSKNPMDSSLFSAQDSSSPSNSSSTNNNNNNNNSNNNADFCSPLLIPSSMSISMPMSMGGGDHPPSSSSSSFYRGSTSANVDLLADLEREITSAQRNGVDPHTLELKINQAKELRRQVRAESMQQVDVQMQMMDDTQSASSSPHSMPSSPLSHRSSPSHSDSHSSAHNNYSQQTYRRDQQSSQAVLQQQPQGAVRQRSDGYPPNLSSQAQQQHPPQQFVFPLRPQPPHNQQAASLIPQLYRSASSSAAATPTTYARTNPHPGPSGMPMVNQGAPTTGQAELQDYQYGAYSPSSHVASVDVPESQNQSQSQSQSQSTTPRHNKRTRSRSEGYNVDAVVPGLPAAVPQAVYGGILNASALSVLSPSSVVPLRAVQENDLDHDDDRHYHTNTGDAQTDEQPSKHPHPNIPVNNTNMNSNSRNAGVSGQHPKALRRIRSTSVTHPPVLADCIDEQGFAGQQGYLQREQDQQQQHHPSAPTTPTHHRQPYPPGAAVPSSHLVKVRSSSNASPVYRAVSSPSTPVSASIISASVNSASTSAFTSPSPSQANTPAAYPQTQGDIHMPPLRLQRKGSVPHSPTVTVVAAANLASGNVSPSLSFAAPLPVTHSSFFPAQTHLNGIKLEREKGLIETTQPYHPATPPHPHPVSHSHVPPSRHSTAASDPVSPVYRGSAHHHPGSSQRSVFGFSSSVPGSPATGSSPANNVIPIVRVKEEAKDDHSSSPMLAARSPLVPQQNQTQPLASMKAEDRPISASSSRSSSTPFSGVSSSGVSSEDDESVEHPSPLVRSQVVHSFPVPASLSAAVVSAAQPSVAVKVKKARKKRRKSVDLPEHERWYCPLLCGKYFRRTSSRSIAEHMKSCPKLNTISSNKPAATHANSTSSTNTTTSSTTTPTTTTTTITPPSSSLSIPAFINGLTVATTMKDRSTLATVVSPSSSSMSMSMSMAVGVGGGMAAAVASGGLFSPTHEIRDALGHLSFQPNQIDRSGQHNTNTQRETETEGEQNRRME